MKRITVLFIFIFSVLSFPQVDFSVFPRMAYADLYWLHHNGQANYTSRAFYYPELGDLGLTHSVSYATNASLNAAADNDLKIIAKGFELPFDTTNQNWLPYRYAQGCGNAIDHLAYEAGGTGISVLTTVDDKVGFGVAGSSPGTARSSWWIFGYNGDCIGDHNFLDGTSIVHRAIVGQHSTGILLKAKPDAPHTPIDKRWLHNFVYKLRIRARIQGTIDNTDVARVRIREEVPSTAAVKTGYHEKIMKTDATTTTNLTDITYTIKASDFGGASYVDLVSPGFRKYQDMNVKTGKPSYLWITIEWLGTRNLYVDKIALCDNYYDTLFLSAAATRTAAQNSIKTNLETLFGTVKNYSAFTHLYNDEPYPAMYRAIGQVSSLAETQLGTGKYINGATRSLFIDQAMHANAENRLPYVLYDQYTIHWTTDSASSGTYSIQNAYDSLIYINFGEVGYGVSRYIGLKVAAEWGKNFTPDNVSDDVPMGMTIQVSADRNYDDYGILTYARRAPTYNEILAEGALSLCYGAKAIMYYTIFTDATASKYKVYGLFDEQGNAYNDNVSPPVGLSQNPSATQVPNRRYYAVQELNRRIGLIGNELLQLTWTNGYSIHKGQPTGTYISSVSSGDASASTYVELGLFKKTTQFTDANLEYFMVVNRRTLTTETRNISVTFGKSSTYSNWLVTEIGTSNKWVVAYNGSFSTSYTPGEGKLFKFEPLFEGTSETLSGNVIFNSTIYLTSGKTLTVQPGTTITFNGSNYISVYGTLSAVGTSSSRITFTSPSKGSWFGLSFNFSQSSGTLRYCDIRNATYALYINNSSPTVEYCFIDDAATYGVYIVGDTAQPIIASNFIEADNACVAHYNGGNGLFASNSFRNAIYGVYVSSGSPRYDYYSFGRNKFESSITTDKVNIAAGQPWFGKYQYFYAPASTTNKYIRNNSTSSVDAQYNYWAGGTGPVYYTGTVDRNNPLPLPPTSPAAGPGWTLTKSSSTDFYAGFENASMLFFDGKYSEAKEYFKDLTDKNLDSAYSSYSLNWYMLSSEKLNDTESQTEYLASIKQNKSAHELTKFYAVKWQMKRDLKNGQSKNAKSFATAIEAGSKYDRELSLELAQGMYEYLGDKTGAEDILDKLSKRFTDKDTEYDIHFIKNHMNSFAPTIFKGANGTVESTATVVPVSMNMFDAYPNPFNPTTTIAYSLTESAKVNIKIYDILGSEVSSLVDDVKEAGYYTASFNASDLASGLYFARITISSNSQAPFVKTIKMVLTK